MAPLDNRRTAKRSRAAFTLIELLVTLTIISMVAGLALSGLAASRQRAKIDKTKSTIRKLNEIVMPQYEGYLSRRVAGSTPALRLTALRLLMVQEMPDQWADVYALSAVPATATAPPRRYADYKNALSPTTNYQSAECLGMIITRGGFAADATEFFRTDEMGDIDGDNVPEFWDGWGRPIEFIRWPAGFSSIVQQLSFATNPDPFDPANASGGDYGLIPLIYSTGPDGASYDRATLPSDYAPSRSGGYLVLAGAMSSPSLLSITTLSPLPGTSTASGGSDADNITNHDLTKK
jgi:prepilin-type N-terminal cleavage/methylation domain-containing protein